MSFVSSILSQVSTLVDEIPGSYVPQDDLETSIASTSMDVVMWSATLLFVFTVVAMLFSGKYKQLKMPLFISMSVTMAASTLFLIGSTVYLNTSADSGGPVHWHADIEFWACGNELELRDPTGFLSNKIGTSTLHEHDDHRIHLEGVVVDETIDASLGKFMHVSGGAITDTSLVLPLNEENPGNVFEDEEDGDGPAMTNPSLIDQYIVEDPELGKIASFRDGQMCGEEVADVQVYVYNYNSDDKTYRQTKLDNPRDYVITDDPNVPPGDCVIFEFGPERSQTDKLCEQYGIRDIDRCEEFGVSASQREICEMQQVDYPSEGTIENEVEAAQGVQGITTHTNPATEELRDACFADMELYNASDGIPEPCLKYEQALVNDSEAAIEAAAEAAKRRGEL